MPPTSPSRCRSDGVHLVLPIVERSSKEPSAHEPWYCIIFSHRLTSSPVESIQSTFSPLCVPAETETHQALNTFILTVWSPTMWDSDPGTNYAPVLLWKLQTLHGLPSNKLCHLFTCKNEKQPASYVWDTRENVCYRCPCPV